MQRLSIKVSVERTNRDGDRLSLVLHDLTLCSTFLPERKRPIQVKDEVVEQVSNEYVDLLNAKRVKLSPKLNLQTAPAANNSSSVKVEPDDNEEQKVARPALAVDDLELMQEFEEDTETIFKQSETCYTHYKAMLR